MRNKKLLAANKKRQEIWFALSLPEKIVKQFRVHRVLTSRNFVSLMKSMRSSLRRLDNGQILISLQEVRWMLSRFYTPQIRQNFYLQRSKNCRIAAKAINSIFVKESCDISDWILHKQNVYDKMTIPFLVWRRDKFSHEI